MSVQGQNDMVSDIRIELPPMSRQHRNRQIAMEREIEQTERFVLFLKGAIALYCFGMTVASTVALILKLDNRNDGETMLGGLHTRCVWDQFKALIGMDILMFLGTLISVWHMVVPEIEGKFASKFRRFATVFWVLAFIGMTSWCGDLAFSEHQMICGTYPVEFYVLFLIYVITLIVAGGISFMIGLCFCCWNCCREPDY